MADEVLTPNADDQMRTRRQDEARSIIQTYMGWSAGASFLPVPLVDLAAVTGVQIKMVADIAALYQVPFSANVVKTIIAGLVGSALPYTLTRSATSLVKSIPLVGTAMGLLTGPALTVASTYAIGRVFIQHFESGGNLFNFDPDAMRAYYRSEFEKGVEQATEEQKAAA
ncbi:YcjF family protein [Endothiovibrio diazotrophicus]